MPSTGLPDITVGRTGSIQHVRSKLDQLTLTGQVEVDCVQGSYGNGKSHLLGVIAAEAKDRGFAVASITTNFDTVVLHRASLAFRAIMANLELPNNPATGVVALLRNLIEQPGFYERAEALYDRWMSRRSSYDDSFGVWPPGFFAAAAHPGLSEPVGRWLSGEPTLISQVKAMIGTVCATPPRMAVTTSTLPDIISGLAKSLSVLGHEGLVLVIDEGENALGPGCTVGQRVKSASFLRDLSRRHAPLYVVVATTPSVVLATHQVADDRRHGWSYYDERGPSRFILQRLHADKRLMADELTSRDLHTLGRKIVELHSEVFCWNAGAQVGEAELERTVLRSLAAGQPTRAFVRETVILLELCEQYPHLAAEQLLNVGSES